MHCTALHCPALHTFSLSPSLQRRLEIPLLPRHPLRLALGHNPLAQPLGRKAAIQHLEILHHVPATADNRLLGRHRPVCLHAQLKRREERVRHLVSCEDDVVVFQEALREQVAQRVVFFVEGEDCGVRYARLFFVLDLFLAFVQEEEFESEWGVRKGLEVVVGRVFEVGGEWW
jgi:hypothetical protein